MEDQPMTEDDLLAGVTEALTLSGWRWTHLLRSDGVTMGSSGLPDMIAVHPTRGLALAWELKGSGLALAWELKGTGGRPTGDQVAWIASFAAICGVDARILYPPDYDRALAYIVGQVGYFDAVLPAPTKA
jgi:hypothetical protein